MVRGNPGVSGVTIYGHTLRVFSRMTAAVEDELRAWMEDRDYESVAQLRGSANQATVADPSAFERANYMSTLHSWTASQDPV